MNSDQLVEETRAIGKAYIDSFKGDAKALLDDLRRREKASGRRVVNFAPKPPRVRTAK